MKAFVVLSILIPTITLGAPEATYHRAFQGFRRGDVPERVFLARLPGFMNSTLDHYRQRINNYLVAVPPAQKPSFVPDEFALVSVESQASYNELRSTPEGQRYSDSHWEIFERSTSRSVNYTVGTPASVEAGQSYFVLGERLDWRAGHSMFALALRKNGKSNAAYLEFLRKHATDVAREFAPRGLKGYIFIAQENYEAAWLNWSSEKEMMAAFQSPAGKKIVEEAGEFLTSLQWTGAQPFDGTRVAPGGFYTTVPVE